MLRATPYPLLEEAADGGTIVHLLVEPGKHGAQRRAAEHGDRRVIVRGTLLSRGGRSIIELVAGAGAIHPDDADNSPAPPSDPTTDLGPVTMRGEILDAKCYLGAMKPGDGKGHKACATLCIRGAIPAMFFSRDADGRARYHLILDSRGGRAPESILPMVGEPVELAGREYSWNNLKLIVPDPGGVTRLARGPFERSTLVCNPPIASDDRRAF